MLRNRLCIPALVFSLILTSAVQVQAQNPKKTDSSTSKFKRGDEIESLYDEKKNQTTVFTDWYAVYIGLRDPKRTSPRDLELDRMNNSVYVNAAIVFTGQTLSAIPEAVEFGFDINNQGGQIFKVGDKPDLAAIVDGEFISLGQAHTEKSKSRVYTLDSIIPATQQISSATLYARFKYQGLKRIIRGKTVRFVIGKFQFNLREGNIEMLQDLAGKIESQLNGNGH